MRLAHDDPQVPENARPRWNCKRRARGVGWSRDRSRHGVVPAARRARARRAVSHLREPALRTGLSGKPARHRRYVRAGSGGGVDERRRRRQQRGSVASPPKSAGSWRPAAWGPGQRAEAARRWAAAWAGRRPWAAERRVPWGRWAGTPTRQGRRSLTAGGSQAQRSHSASSPTFRSCLGPPMFTDEKRRARRLRLRSAAHARARGDPGVHVDEGVDADPARPDEPAHCAGGKCGLRWARDYKLSTAVWVGLIAVAGVAAGTGIVMIVYLDESYSRLRPAHLRARFFVTCLVSGLASGLVSGLRLNCVPVEGIGLGDARRSRP